MPFIGFDRNTGLFYEGSFPFMQAVWPPPATIPARIVQASSEDLSPPYRVELESVTRVFREDSFDPTTRVRRGRFYDEWNVKPTACEVYPHPSRPSEVGQAKQGSGTITKQLVVFQPAHLGELESREPHIAIVGTGTHSSIWLIIGVEETVTKEKSVSLRARQSYGALPELIPAAIPQAGRSRLADAVGKLREDVFRSGVESVVDRAREVANVAFSVYMQSEDLAKTGLELFDLLQAHDRIPEDKKDKKKILAASAANIARLLHSRGKSSQQEKFLKTPLRPLTEQDAELAVACAGAILCEFGWAKWS